MRRPAGETPQRRDVPKGIAVTGAEPGRRAIARRSAPGTGQGGQIHHERWRQSDAARRAIVSRQPALSVKHAVICGHRDVGNVFASATAILRLVLFQTSGSNASLCFWAHKLRIVRDLTERVVATPPALAKRNQSASGAISSRSTDMPIWSTALHNMSSAEPAHRSTNSSAFRRL